MTTPDHGPGPHGDLAAHLLGALEPEREARFAAHLAHCPRCTAEAAELAPVTALLAELAPAAGRDAAPPEPPPELLDRLAGQVAAERRRAKVRRLVLAAVAAILALGGPAVTWALTEGPQVAAVAQQFSATDAATGVSATVGVDPAAWGSRITLDLGHLSGPQSCTLVAVGTDGSRQTVTSWTVPATGYGATTGLRTGGGTGLAPSAIARFEVHSGAAVLVTVPARR
ncbi:anti-sigma factor family protein [Kitasatospora sp. NPDC004531]